MLNNIFSNSKAKVFTIPTNQQVKGDVESSIAVVVCGSVDGDITSASDIFIKAGGAVFGKISAANAVIEGKVIGMITCKERVTALAGAVVEGEIAAAEVSIEPGAVFIEKKRVVPDEDTSVKPEVKNEETARPVQRPEIKGDEKVTAVVNYVPGHPLTSQRWF